MNISKAISDRAIWFALMYREFSKVLPEEEVERAARAAIFKFGILKGKNDEADFDPIKWNNNHIKKGSAVIFETKMEILEGGCYAQHMTTCPLVDGWKKIECTQDELEKYCDIAMEGDRGRAAYHSLPMTLGKTMAQGAPYCELKICKKDCNCDPKIKW